MKSVGAVVIMLGAALGFLRFRRQLISDLQLGRALANDLAVLKREICISRRTLPSICLALENSRGGQVFWEQLRNSLEAGGMSVQHCWETATRTLPESLAVRLAPLGALLGEGGMSFAKAVDEVRDELLHDLGEGEQTISFTIRLAGAVFLSCASFLILMLY